MYRRGWFIVLCWALCLPLLPLGCSRRGAPPSALFGDLKGLEDTELQPADLGPYLAFTRAVLAGKDDAPVPGLSSRPGRRVFVTLYHGGDDPLVTSGLGKTMQDSVRAAAQLARSTRHPLEEIRIQLDVVAAVEFEELPEEIRPEPGEIGRFGYLLARDDRRFGFVLPGEIITRELYDKSKKGRLRRKKIDKLVASRARMKVEDLDEARAWRIETVSAVESWPPGRALPLYRGVVERKDRLTPEELIDAVRIGADYLVRTLDANGRYLYNYKTIEARPGKDEDGLVYNMLRHCGTTYAILEAYEYFGDPRYLEAAGRSIRYAYGRLRPRPEMVPARPGIGDFLHIVDEDRAEMSKLGGAGLALIMLAKHAALTGQDTHLETMRGIARYVRHQQEDNGHFLSYLQWKPDRPVKQKEILYYPGEAILGLMRLYALDPDPRWLETAKKAASYLIFTRDADKTEDNIEHDHWLSYGLNELYRVTKTRAFADHAFKISRAIMKKQKSRAEAPAPDFVGGFYKIPASTPASVRLEAYTADIALARYLGESEASLVDAAMDTAAFIRAQQLDEQGAYFVPDPATAVGGVRESLVFNDIRIDYVQHAMSGWLGFARLLKDPAFGKTGEPGVLPVKKLEPGPPPPSIGLISDKGGKPDADADSKEAGSAGGDPPGEE